MRAKRTAVFLLLSIVSYLNAQPIRKVALKHDESFQPVAKGVGFKTIPMLESDGRSLLFTADNQSHSIYVLSDYGNLIYSNERHGQGPGDLQYPWKIDFSEDNLFVCDMNGLSIFSKDLVFKKRIRLFKDVYSIAASDTHIFIVEGQSQALITAYDHSGKEVGSFGSRYHIDPYNGEGPITFRSYDTVYHLSNLVYGQNKVYFISQMLGDIFVFTEDGRFLKKKEFLEEQRILNNRKILLASGLPDLNKFGVNSRFFGDAQWAGGNIYALVFQRNKKSGEIWEIDGESLDVKAVYEFTHNSAFSTGSLAVMFESRFPIFYLSIRNQESGDIEIAKYTIPLSSAQGQR